MTSPVQAPGIVYTTTRPSDDPEWDRFVESHPCAHLEQTTAWAEVQRVRGWSAIRLVANQEGRVVGGAQILFRPLGRFGAIGYLQRGPLLAGAEGASGLEMMSEVRRLASQLRIRYLSAVLPYEGSPTESDLLGSGMMRQPPVLPPLSSENATIIIDLRPSLDEIFKRMRHTTQRYIRQGLKRGLVVRAGDHRDLPVFEDLMQKLCARRGVKPNVPTGRFLEVLWEQFHRRGQIRMFVSESAGQPIGSLLMITTGTWARAWRIGWSGENPELRPSELIYWKAIEWAKSAGCHHFDYMGFDSRVAKCLANGESFPLDDDSARLALFKHGFGGNPLILPPRYCYFAPAPIRGLMRMGGLQLFDLPVVAWLVRRWARVG